jgi:two-component system, LytTR family, response regulator
MNRLIEPGLSNDLHQHSIQIGSAKKHSVRTIRIALVDDEPLALRAMQRALDEVQDIEIVAECSSGEDVLRMLPTLQPDLIFLDIEMPGMSGMEIAQQLQGRDSPYIVFVTAYDKYALEAFKVQAIDYILKPICEEKVRDVMKRIAESMRLNRWQEVDSRLGTIIHMIERQKKELPMPGELDRFTIKNRGRIYFIETSSIDWIQAEGNYVTLHTGSNKHLLRIKMNQLEERLNSKLFVRVHRSTIVNIQSIKELRPFFNGSYLILLTDNTKIYSSRGYKENVEQILK